MGRQSTAIVIAKNLTPQLCVRPDGSFPQAEFLKSNARFVGAFAGTRGGKTRTAAAKFVVRILKDYKRGKGREPAGVGKDRRARLHYWVVSPTSDLLKEPKRYLMEMIPAELYEDPKRPISHENQMWLVKDILIEFRSADHPLSLVSVGLNGLWLDEAARIKADAWQGNLRGRLSDKQGWALFSSTPLGQNWLWTDIVRKGTPGDPDYHPDFKVIVWHTADNQTIDRREIAAAKATMSTRFYKREYEADFSAFLGTVFDEFSESTHVQTQAEFALAMGARGNSPAALRGLFRRIIAGVDWGWSSPGAIIVVGDLGGRYVVLDESYASHRRVFDPQLSGETWVGEARRLRDLWGVSQFFCDPSAPDKIHEFMRVGLPAVGAYNDIIYGVRKLSEAMHIENGKSRFTVLSHCANFIREAKAYLWDEVKGTDGFADLPAPNQSDHALDAGRYGIVELMRFEDNILSQQRPQGLARPRF